MSTIDPALVDRISKSALAALKSFPNPTEETKIEIAANIQALNLLFYADLERKGIVFTDEDAEAAQATAEAVFDKWLAAVEKIVQQANEAAPINGADQG